jgi:putative redox protein
VKAETKWLGKMKFATMPPSGHEIVMDASPRVGGEDTAPRPMELYLAGLAGCTGIDVVSILNKMRQELTAYRIEAEVEEAPEHPRKFVKVTLRHILEGRNLEEAMVKKAIDLSTDKYCSAQATLKDHVDVETTFEIVPAE